MAENTFNDDLPFSDKLPVALNHSKEYSPRTKQKDIKIRNLK